MAQASRFGVALGLVECRTFVAAVSRLLSNRVTLFLLTARAPVITIGGLPIGAKPILVTLTAACGPAVLPLAIVI